MKRIGAFFSKAGAKARKRLNIKSEMGVLYVYRSISLLLTSAFYLFGDARLPLYYKAGVVTSLFLASLIVLHIYAGYRQENRKIPWAMVLVETIGLSMLLMPTGGLSSPFLWYALNPVLVSACFLTVAFSWCNLLFFCCCATAISYFMFNPFGMRLGSLLAANSYVFLVFVLITYAVWLLARLLHKSAVDAAIIEERRRELEDLNGKLVGANKRANESMDRMMALYGCVGAITSQSDRHTILETFVDCAAALSGAAGAFFLPLGESGSREDAVCRRNVSEGTREALLGEYDALSEASAGHLAPFFAEVCGQTAAAVGIESSCIRGLLGVSFAESLGDDEKPAVSGMITFLGRLCLVVLERIAKEETENRLLIAQEQNRIANEMHDSVSQRLFSMVCALHSISGRWKRLSKAEIKSQLDLVAQCASEASKELRICIYSLSLTQKSLSFFKELRHYLENTARLNSLRIETDLSGEDALLNAEVRRAISRIVRETVSNAIRHGKCMNIGVRLHIAEDAAHLTVTDDGCGADAATLGPAQSHGLGLSNMRAMAQELDGDFSITSTIGVGTQVCVMLPLGLECMPMRKEAL